MTDTPPAPRRCEQCHTALQPRESRCAACGSLSTDSIAHWPPPDPRDRNVQTDTPPVESPLHAASARVVRYRRRWKVAIITLVCVAGVAGDLALRNMSSASALHAIDTANTVLNTYTINVTRGALRYDLDTSAGKDVFLVEVYQPLAEKALKEYSTALHDVKNVQVALWHGAVIDTQDRYLRYSEVWLEVLEERSSGSSTVTDTTDYPPATVQPWNEFCATAPRAVPYFDYNGVGRLLFYILDKQPCDV